MIDNLKDKCHFHGCIWILYDRRDSEVFFRRGPIQKLQNSDQNSEYLVYHIQIVATKILE
jgi:hypothetical protein